MLTENNFLNSWGDKINKIQEEESKKLKEKIKSIHSNNQFIEGRQKNSIRNAFGEFVLRLMLYSKNYGFYSYAFEKELFDKCLNNEITYNEFKDITNDKLFPKIAEFEEYQFSIRYNK